MTDPSVFAVALGAGLLWALVGGFVVRYALELALAERQGRPPSAAQRFAMGASIALLMAVAAFSCTVVEHAYPRAGFVMFLAWLVPNASYAVYARHRSGLPFF